MQVHTAQYGGMWTPKSPARDQKDQIEAWQSFSRRNHRETRQRKENSLVCCWCVKRQAGQAGQAGQAWRAYSNGNTTDRPCPPSGGMGNLFAKSKARTVGISSRSPPPRPLSCSARLPLLAAAYHQRERNMARCMTRAGRASDFIKRTPITIPRDIPSRLGRDQSDTGVPGI